MHSFLNKDDICQRQQIIVPLLLGIDNPDYDLNNQTGIYTIYIE